MSIVSPGDARRAGHILAVLLAGAGCGTPLQNARLEPPAVAAGVVKVTVTEVATTADLQGSRQNRLQEHAEVMAQVMIENAATGPVRVDLDRWRLAMTGPGGQSVTGTPVGVFEKITNLGGRKARTVAPVVLEAGKTKTLAIAFRGLGGLSTDGAVAIRLETGGMTSPVALAAPAAPGPRWELKGVVPIVVAMRVGGWSGPGFRLFDTFAPQMYLGIGRLVVGYGVASPAIIVQDADGESRLHAAVGFSPRVGWLPPSWTAGVVAGPDFWWFAGKGESLGPWMASATLTARFSMGPWRHLLTPLPLAARGHALAPAWLDVSYVRWFGRGLLPSGNGTMFSFCFGLMMLE